MTKKQSFRAAMKSYIKMAKHLKTFIGSRSKTTICGLTRPDDALALDCEAAIMGAKRKCRGGKIKQGRKPCCYRVKQ